MHEHDHDVPQTEYHDFIRINICLFICYSLFIEFNAKKGENTFSI